MPAMMTSGVLAFREIGSRSISGDSESQYSPSVHVNKRAMEAFVCDTTTSPSSAGSMAPISTNTPPARRPP